MIDQSSEIRQDEELDRILNIFGASDRNRQCSILSAIEKANNRAEIALFVKRVYEECDDPWLRGRTLMLVKNCKLQITEAIPFILSSCLDEDPWVREQAIHALIAVEPNLQRILATLKTMENDLDKWVRSTACNETKRLLNGEMVTMRARLALRTSSIQEKPNNVKVRKGLQIHLKTALWLMVVTSLDLGLWIFISRIFLPIHLPPLILCGVVVTSVHVLQIMDWLECLNLNIFLRLSLPLFCAAMGGICVIVMYSMIIGDDESSFTMFWVSIAVLCGCVAAFFFAIPVELARLICYWLWCGPSFMKQAKQESL